MHERRIVCISVVVSVWNPPYGTGGRFEVRTMQGVNDRRPLRGHETIFDAMLCRAWRCVHCGHVTDSVTVENRQRQVLVVPTNAELEETVIKTYSEGVTAWAV